MMNKFKKSRVVIMSTVISLVALFLLLASINMSTITSKDIRFVNFLERVFSKPTQFLLETKDNFLNLYQTYEENQSLKERISHLENLESGYESLKQEETSLKQALGLNDSLTEGIKINANVTTRLPNTWLDSVSVDKGEDAGVTEDMLVLANGGLVGYVDELGGTATGVQLLSSSSEAMKKIPVRVSLGETSIYGILTEYDRKSNAFIVTQLNSSEAIAEGSQVVSSDLGGKTPPNVPIGQVVKVVENSDSLNREVYVTPAADFSNIYVVTFVGK